MLLVPYIGELNMGKLSLAILVCILAGCTESVTALLSPEAGESVAPLNPNSGQEVIRLRAEVDKRLFVVVSVNYSPSEAKWGALGCYYTTNVLEGARAERTVIRKFPLKAGPNVIGIPVDEVLPGRCEFSARVISFDIQSVEDGTKSLQAHGFGSAPDGVLTLPLEVIECVHGEAYGKAMDLQCWPDWMKRPLNDPVRKQAVAASLPPVSRNNGNVSYEFRYMDARKETKNPVIQAR
jgi:hypothetical protein